MPESKGDKKEVGVGSHPALALENAAASPSGASRALFIPPSTPRQPSSGRRPKRGADSAASEASSAPEESTASAGRATAKHTENCAGQLQTLADVSPDFIALLTPAGALSYLNPAGRRLCALPEGEAVEGTSLGDYISPGKMEERLNQGLLLAAQNGQWLGETELLSRDGTVVPGTQQLVANYDAHGVLDGLSCVVRDNRPLRDLQAQLTQGKRLEAIGKLAGGIAHDFNNLLTVIENYVSFAQDELKPETQAFADLQQARTASGRAADLCQQLLSFARRQMIQPRSLRLGESVQEFSNLLHRILGEDIHLQLEIQQDVPQVMLDPSQLEQVLANLVVNARDAMPRGGQLKLRVSGVTPSSAASFFGQQRPPGHFALLSVQDTGTGISESVLQHIFEPFFTTKGAGHGSGLGLSTVFGAVRQNHGYIDVRTTVGSGTDFQIYWPAAKKPV